jgi:hypothetical protein
MPTNNGPMTLERFSQTSEFASADIRLFEGFLAEHAAEFTGQPRPIQPDFQSISHALAFSLSLCPEGGSVEERTWSLCLSTVNTLETITGRNVARTIAVDGPFQSHVAGTIHTD